MKVISKALNYFNKHDKCYIPKCRARCCVDAPLPEGFVERFQSRIQRSIYGAINIGVNDPKDNFNSIIYNTRPIQIVHVDRRTGQKTYGIAKDMMEQLELKSMEDVYNLLKQYEAQKIYNYCPFITPNARCSVYEHRPPICREFGTSYAKVDICPDKSSRLDIIKFVLSDLFNFKEGFKNIKNLFKSKKS